jgi:hypothetical protein
MKHNIETDRPNTPHYQVNTASERVAFLLFHRGIDQHKFIYGLRLLGYDVPCDAQIVFEIPEEVCKEALTRPFAKLMAEIKAWSGPCPGSRARRSRWHLHRTRAVESKRDESTAH